MKELSREEKLRQQIYNFERIADDKKWRRVKKTFFVLSVVVYIAVFFLDGMNSIQDYLGWIIAAPISAGLIIFISTLVTLYITTGAMNDEKYLARLQGQLDAIQSTRKDGQ